MSEDKIFIYITKDMCVFIYVHVCAYLCMCTAQYLTFLVICRLAITLV